MRCGGPGSDLGVRVLDDGHKETVPAKDLRKGDIVRVEKDNVMPADGEVIEGAAFVNEFAITGELAPVLKEAGTDMFSSVTAGTTIISDWLLIRVTTNPGDTFLDRMICSAPRSQAAEDPQRDRPYRASLDPDADFCDCRRVDRAGGDLPASAD